MATVTTGFEIHGLDGFDEEPPSVNVPPDGPVDVMTRAWGVNTINLDPDARVLVSEGARTLVHSDGDPTIAATILTLAIELAAEKSSDAAEYLTELLDRVGAEPLDDADVIDLIAGDDETEDEELADAA